MLLDMRFVDYLLQRLKESVFGYEIYDFDLDSWTTLDVSPHWHIISCDLGITLKRNTYWHAREMNSEENIVDHIICFDFTRERFRPLLPLPVSVGDHDYEYLTLSCVGEEKLAALFEHTESNPYELEIWITTKIEAEMVSWSKFLRMDTGPDILVTTICEGYFIAMAFNEDIPRTFIIIGEAGYLINLDIGVLTNQMCRLHMSALMFQVWSKSRNLH